MAYLALAYLGPLGIPSRSAELLAPLVTFAVLAPGGGQATRIFPPNHWIGLALASWVAAVWAAAASW